MVAKMEYNQQKHYNQPGHKYPMVKGLNTHVFQISQLSGANSCAKPSQMTQKLFLGGGNQTLGALRVILITSALWCHDV